MSDFTQSEDEMALEREQLDEEASEAFLDDYFEMLDEDEEDAVDTVQLY